MYTGGKIDMATMKQIAQIAGVSRGTVDRVLNNRGTVRPETKKRILEVVEALKYTPNQAARNLSFARQQLKLGCILFNPDIIDFYQQILDAVEQKRRELMQYSVTVDIRFTDYNDAASQNQLLDELAADGAAGIALFGVNAESTRQKIAKLHAQGIPVVTSNTDIPDSHRIAFVGCDFVKSGRVAGQLIDMCLRGTGTAAVVLGAQQVLCLEGRLQGMREYLSEHAPGIQLVDIRKNNPDDFTMFVAVKEILESNPELDALLVDSGNSYGACRAIELFAKPHRPKVICFDCSPRTEQMLKKGIITATITQQPEIQGGLPLELLMNYLGTGTALEKELYFTELGIKVSENL